MGLYLRQLNELWGEPEYDFRPDFSDSFDDICTDSRKVLEGSLFVPLIGEKFNGHEFLPQALERGAQGAVVAKEFAETVPKGFLHWLVDDTLEAYQQLALLHRCDLDIPVVAVTGSVGKTTTRELIKEVLTSLGSITSSAENNNNDIGVPLTLLQAKKNDAAIVVEMGMRGLGEIKRLSCCSQPDIAVITNIGTAHIGRLGSRKNIAIAKCEITTSLKSSGVVIIPASDPLLEEVLNDFWKGRVVKVEIWEQLSSEWPSSILIDSSRLLDDNFIGLLDMSEALLKVEDKIFQLPLEGRHNAQNFLLALAVARELGISLQEIKQLNVQVPVGRSKSFTFGGITVLDESYNSSPESVEASMELLVAKTGRHFAVLGTMLELGEQSVSLHKQVAERAVDFGLDGLLIVAEGAEADSMKGAAKSLPQLAVVSNPEDAFNTLRFWLKPGDVVLVKASRAVEIERLIPLLDKHFGKS